MSKKVVKAAKATAKKFEKKRVRPPRTEAQKARRCELAALKKAESAKAGAFLKALVALMKKLKLV